jgi:hypothetical protein
MDHVNFEDPERIDIDKSKKIAEVIKSLVRTSRYMKANRSSM